MYLRSRKKISREVSLYEPVGTDKEGNQIRLLDICESEERDVVEEMDLSRRTRLLRKLIPEVLHGREREIITMRYGLNQKPPMTQRQIAARIGISRSYVSRIEKKALERLREAFLRQEAEGEACKTPKSMLQ
jgi:RNA polymerase sporulation-specific sigma factor